MITRFYVDNYKCLQNFEYKPNQLELIVGANGTGKTTVFEALDKVRQFVTGQTETNELFDFSTITRWSIKPPQIFEVDYQIENHLFQYRLETNIFSYVHRVEKETLRRNGEVLTETVWEDMEEDNPNYDPFAEESLTDFHPNQTRALKQALRPNSKVILSNPSQSAMKFASPLLRNTLGEVHFFKINPASITSQVGKVEPRPANDLSNFASYYLYLLQQKQGKMFEMIPYLREAIPDFDSFAIEEDFEAGRRELRVVCRAASKRNSASTVKYGFEEMSDGQRALIALYTLLFCTLDSNSTLIIDEPENYIALRELQPWLMLLQERLEEHGGQVILISHHPEFINALAPSHTTVFEREIGGPVRIKPFNMELAKSLTPAEVIARGWESE